MSEVATKPAPDPLWVDPGREGGPAAPPAAVPAGRSAAVRLAAVSDTAAALSLHAELTLAVAGRGKVRVLAEDVERMSTACVQLLLAADHSLTRHGGGIVVSGATEGMRGAFADLGLADDLARWSDAHG